MNGEGEFVILLVNFSFCAVHLYTNNNILFVIPLSKRISLDRPTTQAVNGFNPEPFIEADWSQPFIEADWPNPFIEADWPKPFIEADWTKPFIEADWSQTFVEAYWPKPLIEAHWPKPYIGADKFPFSSQMLSSSQNVWRLRLKRITPGLVGIKNLLINASRYVMNLDKPGYDIRTC